MDTICLWWEEGSEIEHKREKRKGILPEWGEGEWEPCDIISLNTKDILFAQEGIFSPRISSLLPLCGNSSFFSSFLLLQMCWTVAAFGLPRRMGGSQIEIYQLKARPALLRRGRAKKPRDLSHSLNGAIKAALPSSLSLFLTDHSRSIDSTSSQPFYFIRSRYGSCSNHTPPPFFVAPTRQLLMSKSWF